MWKRGLIGFFIAAATLALTAPIAHYDGRCGAQTWKALVWGPFDAPEDAYFDEFGIVEAWMRGHNGRSCPFLWQRGDLGPLTESEYFPPLHFLIASGADTIRVRDAIQSLSVAESTKKDKLGRTALHWLAVYTPHAGYLSQEVKASLVQALLDRGLSLDDVDEDGLSPRDWARSAGVPLT